MQNRFAKAARLLFSLDGLKWIPKLSKVWKYFVHSTSTNSLTNHSFKPIMAVTFYAHIEINPEMSLSVVYCMCYFMVWLIIIEQSFVKYMNFGVGR